MSDTSHTLSAKAQLIQIFANLPRIIPQWVRVEMFRSVALYWSERVVDYELLEAVARTTGVPLPIARLYVAYPPVSVYERWRRREPLKIKDALASTESEELHVWIIALSIYHTIFKHDGTLGHSALLRQLDHQVEAQEVKQALALLREASLIESFDEPGKQPWRPIVHHRIASAIGSNVKDGSHMRKVQVG